MVFWSFFFNNTKNEYYKKNNKETLLITELNHNNKILKVYLSFENNINMLELEKLCDTVGWVRRPITKVKIALENSFLIISIFYYNNHKKELIGFARATSDNSFNATIWDVVIHPEFQKKGLGKILMNQLIKELRYHEISTITLFADPQVIKFYTHLGFLMDPDGVKGMFWYPIQN
uniref:N-acetyltransferase domain-containing protein n=1 Tax=Dasyclonium flaccidum TaxID=2007274 RepID=A0A1Z1MLB1_9FLOR|nr:hypothetical protein [Dasyclonium flaccidum]ARW66531.1 hypothetical protein [Dasyclonium flaccidum]